MARVKLSLGRATAGVPNGAKAAVFVVVPTGEEFAPVIDFLDALNGAGASVDDYAFNVGVNDGTNPAPAIFPDASDEGGTVFLVAPATWNRLRTNRF
jgi:hypothetical protein